MTRTIKMASLVMLALISLNSPAWARDFKTMSTVELRNLRDTMHNASQIERHEYNNEMLGRLEQMTPAERQDYMASGNRMDNRDSSRHSGAMGDDSRNDNRDDHSWNDSSGGSGSGGSGSGGSGSGGSGSGGSGSGGSGGGHDGNDNGGRGDNHGGNDSGGRGGDRW